MRFGKGLTPPLRKTVLISALFILCQIGTIALAQEFATPRLEFGPELTQIYLPITPVGSVQYQPGYGAVMCLRTSTRIGVDTGFSITPTTPIFSSSFAGGRLTEAFFGARIRPLSVRRLELYAKVRPGFVSFGDAILHVSLPSLQVETGRLTEPALDLGAIALLRISRRWAVRYEMGDTMIHYGGRVVDFSQPETPSHLANSLQLGVGFVVGF